MFGSGFIGDVITTGRNNRRLLKDEQGPHYQNFDRSAYIKGNVKSEFRAEFAEADPEYITLLKAQLIQLNEYNKRIRWRIIIICTSLTLILFSLFFIIWV